MSSIKKIEADESQSVTSSNNHVLNFLDEYYFLKTPPQYAVLLKGPWGSGKTWFIKKSIERLHRKSGKELYVSLYGLTSFVAIEDEFFKQLHPLLSHKAMSLTGKVLKGLLKTSLHIDLNNDGKSDGSVSSSIPEVNLPDYLTNTEGLVLIFDDLERCSIPIGDILGYINHFVEHQEYKVVIIANEDDIKADAQKKGTYEKIKEKLIGKTFQIDADIDSAIDSFIAEIDTPNRDHIKNNIPIVKAIYHSSQFNNLRHLRQSLADFSRLYHHLSIDAKNSDPLIKHLLQIFLSLSFEIKHGKLPSESLYTLDREFISYSVKANTKQKTEKRPYLFDLIEKYDGVDFHTRLLQPNTWFDILDKGLIDTDLIQSELANSQYLLSDKTPNWVKLWHFLNLDDSSFEYLLESVKQQFKENYFSELPIIKHVAGMLFYFSSKGISDQSIEEVRTQAEACISQLRAEGKLHKLNSSKHPRQLDDSALGLEYLGRELESFAELQKYILSESIASYEDSLPGSAMELLDIMKNDSQLFCESLLDGYSPVGTFGSSPILAKIAPALFVETLLSLKPEDIQRASDFMPHRYANHNLHNLNSERAWLTDVKKLLERRSNDGKGKLSGYRIMTIINFKLTPSITAFEEYFS